MYNRREILPKCWLARIQKYWKKTIPNDYPATEDVEFSLSFTPEDYLTIQDMEKSIGTEESIITPEMVPEKQALATYIGTYNVLVAIEDDVEKEEAEPEVNAEDGGEVIAPKRNVADEGEDEDKSVLISPVKLDKKDVGVIAFALKEDAWVQLEDASIKDGYAYATLEESAPVAVFSTRYDGYVDESGSILPGKVYVCNGVFTRVYLDEDDKIIAESAYGTKTELDSTFSVIGGSYGTDISISETNLYIGKGVELNNVFGGSYAFDEEFKSHINTINVTAEDATIRYLGGAGIWCSADEVNIEATRCKVASGLGAQVCFYKNHTSMPELEDAMKRLGANQWVKKANLNVTDCEVYCLYPAGMNGFCYTKEATMVVNGGKYEYLCIGQSNGLVDESHVFINGAEIKYLNSNNRGAAGDLYGTLKASKIEKMFAFGDPSDEASTLDKVGWDLDADCEVVALQVGSIESVPVTDPEVAAKYIDYFKISRDTKIDEYIDGADKIIKITIK